MIKRFEYQFLSFNPKVETIVGPGGFGQAQDILNMHGHEGWEVVSVVVMTPNTHKYLLKREIHAPVPPAPAASTQPELVSLPSAKKKGGK